MDLDTFKRSVESLSQNVPEGMAVFICDPFSDRQFPDISNALLNTVLIKLSCGWVLATNAFNVSTDTGNVRLYCSSQITFRSPLPDALLHVLRHFFPLDHTVNIFTTGHSFMYKSLSILCVLFSSKML